MSDQQRAVLAIEIEQEVTEMLRAKAIVMNGSMLNRIEMVAELIAELAIKKELVSTR